MSSFPPSPPNLDAITRNFRMRDPRFTGLAVKDILRIRMDDLGIKNPDLQRALGYAKPNVIAMMRSGTMSLPPSKALVAAQLLELDPVFLLNKVIAENDPALWDVTLPLDCVSHNRAHALTCLASHSLSNCIGLT